MSIEIYSSFVDCRNVNVKETLEQGHPLEFREQNYVEREFERNLRMMRGIQGLHAPLK